MCESAFMLAQICYQAAGDRDIEEEEVMMSMRMTNRRDT
jgi:hypothetical protein